MKLKLSVVLFVFFTMVSASQAAVITWTNTAGGSWQTAANWSPNQVPGAADTAEITTPGTYNITLAANVTVTAFNLGAASGKQTITIATHDIKTTTLGTIAANGELVMTGGGLEGNFTVASSGILTFATATQKTFIRTTLINNGTVRWNGGNLATGGNPTTLITNNGLWEINSADTIYHAFGGGAAPAFNNSVTGILRKIAPGSTAFNNLQFINSGTVDVQAGTLTFNGSVDSVLGGTVTTALNAIFHLASGSYTENGGVFTGAGISRMNGGTLLLVNDKLNGLSLNGGNVDLGPAFQNAGAIDDLTINGATLVGANEVSGTLTFTDGGINGEMTVRPGGAIVFSGSTQKTLYATTLINNGTVKWQGGNLSLGSTPSTIVTNAALWEITGDNTMFHGAGGATPLFVNNGTMRKMTGSGATSFNNLEFKNAGVIEIQMGTIQWNGSVNSILGGTFTAAPGADFVLQSGSYTENAATFGGGGSLRMTGGTLTLVNDRMPGLLLNNGDVKLEPTFQAAGAVTNLTISGATLIGANEIAGTLTFTAGGAKDSLTVRPGATLVFSGTTQKTLYGLTLNNNGLVRWLGGNLSLGSTPTTLVTNSAIWEITGDNTAFHGAGGPTPHFVNAGTLRKVAGSGTTSFNNFKFTNIGTVDVQSGTFQFNGAVDMVLGGAFTAAPGADLVLQSGNFIENGATFGGGGNLRMNGGTLTLVNNTMPGLVHTGGDIVLGPSFQGGSITSLTLNGSTLTGVNTVTGTLTVLSGGIKDTLTVAPGGTLTFSGNTQKQLYQSTIVNNGLVRWFGGNLGMGSTPTTIITNNSLWEIASDDTMFHGAGGPTPTFVNETNGIFRKISGSASTSINNLTFINRGLVESQSGTIQFNGANTNSLGGTFNAEADTAINLASGSFVENAATFTGAGSKRFSGGTLLLVNNKMNDLLLTGGNVDLSPTFQDSGAISNLTISGSTLVGVNEVSGALTFTAGGMEDSMTVRPGATILYSGTALKTLYNTTLINNGTIRWQGGNLLFGSTPGTFVTNNSLWEITSDDQIYHAAGGPTPIFANATTGIIRKLSGSGSTTISNIKFDNVGSVDIQNGTIALNGSVDSILGGTFTAATGASFTLGGGAFIENGGVFTGSGAHRMNSGTLSLVTDKLPGLLLAGGDVKVGANFQSAGAITDLTLSGATLVGTNEIAGDLTMTSGGIQGLLTIRPGGTLTLTTAGNKSFYNTTLNNNGTVKWQSGNLLLGSTPTSIINNSGLWEISSDDQMYHATGGLTPEFNNLATGIVKKIAGSGATTISTIIFVNLGVVEAAAGTFRFPNNYAHTLGTLRLSGGRIDATGLLTFAGGTLEGSGIFGSSIFTGGTISPGINGPGKINFPSGLKLTTGASLSIDAQTTTPETGHDQLAVTGTVDLGGATLQVGPMSPFIIGATMNIIDNDSNDPVIGTFASRPEGFLFQVGTQLFRTRYARGTGNDVVLIRDDGGVRLTAIRYFPDGTFQLSGLGTNSGIYKISATTDFQSWTELGETTANGGGLFHFTDTNAHQFPFRFYQSFGPGIDVAE